MWWVKVKEKVPVGQDFIKIKKKYKIKTKWVIRTIQTFRNLNEK